MANPIRVNRTHFNDLVNDNAKLSGAAFTGDVSVTGNLDVTGTTTSVINLDITDSLIGLNNGLVASNTNDSGILIGRGQDTNAFMGWDESAGKFIVGATTATASSTGDLTITTGTLVANLEGNVTGDLTGNAATATTAGECSGNAATATTATTAGECSGNAATATIAFDCSGNAATATIAFDCSGNAATATTAGECSGNAATATTALTVTEAAQAAITSVGTLTGLTMASGADISLNTVTGTRIGTATNQLLGFFNATPVAQQSNIADASLAQGEVEGAPTQAEFNGLRTDVQNLTGKMNTILAALKALGLLANA